ncbi:Protein of unknown function [Gryllus bimaculatus]|nr:Protein of unknown function [Gryllus bimaculatus]
MKGIKPAVEPTEESIPRRRNGLTSEDERQGSCSMLKTFSCPELRGCVIHSVEAPEGTLRA